MSFAIFENDQWRHPVNLRAEFPKVSFPQTIRNETGLPDNVVMVEDRSPNPSETQITTGYDIELINGRYIQVWQYEDLSAE